MRPTDPWLCQGASRHTKYRDTVLHEQAKGWYKTKA